jgi:oxygen-independent coproporphyrinogen III oxidase
MSKASAYTGSELPYLNYYQYPPPLPTGLRNDASIRDWLKLNLVSRNAPFTSFTSIPYCRVRCHSCPFFKELLPHREDQGRLLDDYVNQLIGQMSEFAESGHFDDSECRAIFLGGGTASLLSVTQVATILAAYKEEFRLAHDVEITLEGNPREFKAEYLRGLRTVGVNRLSIGLQSFQDNILRRVINSPHSSHDSHGALRAALDGGFKTVNIDLLYRLPGQTFEDWRADVHSAVGYGPESITFYSYVIHEGSASERLIRRGALSTQADREAEHEWYVWTCDFLSRHGYVEGMKGNFSKPGHGQMYGRLSYLEGSEIVGLGAGTYSFVNRRMLLTTGNTDLYKRRIRSGDRIPIERISAEATDRNMMERYVIFNLMASEVDGQEFMKRFGNYPAAVFPGEVSKLQSCGLMTADGHSLRLTDLGKKWRDHVLFEFYSDTFKVSQAA